MARTSIIIGLLLIATILTSCSIAEQNKAAAEQVREDFEQEVAIKEQELREEQLETRSREMFGKIRTTCERLCAEATSNKCSTEAMAGLCAYNTQSVFPGSYIDLNNDGQQGAGTLRGEQVCEEKIYCYSILESCCSMPLSRESCTTLEEDLFQSKGFSAEDAGAAVRAMMDIGMCKQ